MNIRTHLRPILILLLSAFLPVLNARGEQVLLFLEHGAAEGLVAARVNLTSAVACCGETPVAPSAIAALDADGQKIPFQFIPDHAFSATNNITGTALVQLPAQFRMPLRLDFSGGEVSPADSDGKVTTAFYEVEHSAERHGGFPSRIVFADGKSFTTMRWNNRVHHRDLGSFCLCDDPEARVERISSGPLCDVVRVRAYFVQGGKRPESQPWAVYDWCYFHKEPIAYVTAVFGQDKPYTWHELHFLEMDYPREAFPFWAGGEPFVQGEFQESRKTHSCAQWGAVHDGRNAIGMYQCGQALFYDAGPATYLQAHGDSAWQAWQNTDARFSAWMWIGADEEPARAVQRVARENLFDADVVVTLASVRNRIEAASQQLAKTSPEVRTRKMWQLEGARRLESQGRFAEALSVVEGNGPDNWTVLTSGALTMILERNEDGIQLLDLFDTETRQSLVTSRAEPLFSLTLHDPTSSEELTLTADAGWSEVSVSGRPSDGSIRLSWRRPEERRLGDFEVVAQAVPRPDGDEIRWQLSAKGQAKPWSLWSVVFPQVAVPRLGSATEVFVPKGCGQVQTEVFTEPFRFDGTYPSGWTTMQFMSVYDQQRKTGLYVAVHDPWGSTKQIHGSSRLPRRDVLLKYEHPVPDMGRSENHFQLSGEAVWKLLRGDWFDAASSYRTWARAEARWYPPLTHEGRADTPRWMRELCAWALTGGAPADCVGSVNDLAKDLDLPLGFHWYNWHQIPFDNDYPHYFPTRPNMPRGVQELQDAGVHVMPYINGRLWDTRDKGAQDFQFTSVAFPAVSKNKQGEPYTESYSSKESDGSRVSLGVMCPSTQLWKAKVREIVLRLINECGVHGVYIDQVAAAKPTLCFDETHGHPLGGGHWWTQGYWDMLRQIRAAMPADRMLTTECNGEPYIRYFDGYLTWHWQYDGQVPAFPAVYGGSIQMFGRSFGGGPTRDLALRMKVGQQLVFGEQIGWINPGLARAESNAEFLRQAVHLRHRIVRYFYTGEMARPPKLEGVIPTVRADWQWHGESWVTTDAVLTGAWHIPAENRSVLVFVNVSGEHQSGKLDYDTAECGIQAARVRCQDIGHDGAGPISIDPPRIQRVISLPAHGMMAIEISPSEN
jgi:hypothetical protein